MLIEATPIEKHKTQKGVSILVKREDLCVSSKDGPPFSKMRGVVPYLLSLKKEQVPGIAYVESAISMAGWGLAWAARRIEMEVVIFDPQYKQTPPLLAFHRKQWEKMGARTIPIPAGRTSVNWYRARTWIQKNRSKLELCPIGMILPETITATCTEARTLSFKPKSVVVNVGSGTITAGLVAAFCPEGIDVYGIMGRAGSVTLKKKIILTKAKIPSSGFYAPPGKLILVDAGWGYTERSKCPCPFPAHPWYEGKAWEWLEEHANALPHPILFWNIGRLPDEFK